MSEIDYTNDLLVRLSKRYHPHGVFYRRNVGVAQPIGRDYVMRFGKNGQADIAGVLSGLAIEIENKIGRNGLSEPQKNWRESVTNAGGFYFESRPENEAELLARLDLIAAVGGWRDRE